MGLLIFKLITRYTLLDRLLANANSVHWYFYQVQLLRRTRLIKTVISGASPKESISPTSSNLHASTAGTRTVQYMMRSCTSVHVTNIHNMSLWLEEH